MTAMSPRTRSDILAASSGMTSSQAATLMLFGRQRGRCFDALGGDVKRMKRAALIEFLEFAIDAARGTDGEG